MTYTRRQVLGMGVGAALAHGAGASAALAIDCAFPGGNIIVDSVEGDVVNLHQDLRDTTTDWFYWCFRVRGGAGRTLTFRFTRGRALGLLGPAVSADEGRTWKYLGLDDETPTSFGYRPPAGTSEVRFAVATPYLQSDWERFTARVKRSPLFRQSALCTSRKGRRVELAEAGTPGKPRVLLTARHHACESIANFELEGILDQVLATDETGAWLRQNLHFAVIPFMDKDGVEDGDQGKNRRPRDHNRDYAGESIHPSVAALRKLAASWPAGQLLVHIDLHCPYITDAEINFVGGPNARIWAEVERLSEILEAGQRGPLKFQRRNNIPFGKGWNQAANYTAGKSSSSWSSEMPGILLATSIELPYAKAGGAVVTADSARAFGRDVAAALRTYLEGRPATS